MLEHAKKIAAEIDSMRVGRERIGRIPPELRERILSLFKTHPVKDVCRACHVSESVVRHWKEYKSWRRMGSKGRIKSRNPRAMNLSSSRIASELLTPDVLSITRPDGTTVALPLHAPLAREALMTLLGGS
jgi:hypothetical protein